MTSQPDAAPSIGIIILNWQNTDDTLRCLQAISTSTYQNYRVVVIDNGSSEESKESLRSGCQIFPQTELIESDTNQGYAGGNNLGIRYLLNSDSDYVLLLNDDTVIESNTLEELFDATKLFPDAGFLGPKVFCLETPGVLLSTGGILDRHFSPSNRGIGETDIGQYEEPVRMDFLSGCALLIKRDTIEQIGMLDENFFAYFEEIDWCFRGKLVGRRAMFVPSARVWHPDTRSRDQNSSTVTYYATRNRLLFSRKHDLGWSLTIRLLFQYHRQLLSWTIKPQYRKTHPAAQRKALRQAIKDFYLNRYGKRKT